MCLIFKYFCAQIYDIYMRDINVILRGDNIGSMIAELKDRPYSIPEWNEVMKDYFLATVSQK